MNALQMHPELCTSPWEPVGGNIFINAEPDQAVPNDIALDLSEVEACLQAELPLDAAAALRKPTLVAARQATANKLQHSASAQLLAFSSKVGDVWALAAEAPGSEGLVARNVLSKVLHQCSAPPRPVQFQLVPDARPSSSTSSRNSGDSVVDLAAEDTAAAAAATQHATTSSEDLGEPYGVVPGPIGPPMPTSTRRQQQQQLPFQQIVRLPPSKSCSRSTLSLMPGSSGRYDSQGTGTASAAAAAAGGGGGGQVQPWSGLRRSRSSDEVVQVAAAAPMEAVQQQAGPGGPGGETATLSPAAPPAGGGGVAGSSSSTGGEVFVRTRSEALARYREKRARRVHGKLIRYHLRKVNADNRPRVKGRFVKKSELLAMMQQQEQEHAAAAAQQVYEVVAAAHATGSSSSQEQPPPPVGCSLLPSAPGGRVPVGSCCELQLTGGGVLVGPAELDTAELARLGAVPPLHHLDRLSSGRGGHQWSASATTQSAVVATGAAAAAAAAGGGPAMHHHDNVKGQHHETASGPEGRCSMPCAVAGAEAAMAVGGLMLPEVFDFASMPGAQFEDAAAELLQDDDLFDQVHSVAVVSEVPSDHHSDVVLMLQ